MSAIAEYALENYHPVKWEEDSVIDHASRSGELLVKEALCIHLTSGCEHFKEDEGMDLPKCWMTSTGRRI